MRTKHILTSLALPALFAACTADEFVNEDFGKTAERAKVSKNFSLVTSEDATTRYAVDGETGLKFTFEKGDKIGAAIIDQMDPETDKVENWPIIPSLAGNYPFEYDGSQWKSATTLGIGHYLFVYPYNKDDNNRGAVSYSLPTVQKLYGEDGKLDLNAAIENGDKAVFAAVLKEGDTQLAAKLQGLYTYPKFVINFDNGLPITSVSQVVLEYSHKDAQGNETVKGFEVKGGFSHWRVVDLFNLAEKAPDEKIYWDGVQTADFLIPDNDKDEAYTAKKPSKYLIAKLPENTPIKTNSITNNKYIEVRFMMPGVGAGETGKTEYGNNLKMHIYTNDGIYTIGDVWEQIQWKSTTSRDAMSKALLRGRSNTLTLKKVMAKDSEALTIVTNIADWNALVDAYGATTNQTISIVGDEFHFDSTVKMPSKAVFTVNTPVSVKGDVAMRNVYVANTITVEKGAKLTTGAGFTANSVVNKGSLVVAEVFDNNGDVVTFYGNVKNKGMLTVEKDAKAYFYGFDNAKAAAVENNGTMTVDGQNYGVINNNAVMNTRGFQNMAREYDSRGEKVINEPAINNVKGAKILSEEGTLTNKARIVNEGVLTCKNTRGTIMNATDGQNPAVLDSKADAITYITGNQKGKVVVYSADTEGLTIANEKGIVEYTTANATEDFKNSLVNTVIASKSLEVKDGALNSLTFNGDATLKLGKDATITALTVSKGRTTLATDLTIQKLTVAKGAMVVVPESKVLTVNGNNDNYNKDLYNEGTILVGGTFNATNIQADPYGETGLVEDNGNGKINWKPTDKEQDLADAKTKYEKAMVAVIKLWAESSNNTNTVDKVAYDILKGQANNTGVVRTSEEVFKAYVNAPDKNNKQEFIDLKDYLDEYNGLLGEGNEVELTYCYQDVAAAVVAETEALSAFKNAVKELKWTVTDGASRIYKDDPAGTQNGKTAAEKALTKFKEAVVNEEITITGVQDKDGKDISALCKVAICSSSENYAPACSQVFITDDIYKIFGKEAIRYTDDWAANAGFSHQYTSTTPWDLGYVKKWISDAAKTTTVGENLYVQVAKEYVKENDLINKSKDWTYADKIVSAIAAERYAEE